MLEIWAEKDVIEWEEVLERRPAEERGDERFGGVVEESRSPSGIRMKVIERRHEAAGAGDASRLKCGRMSRSCTAIMRCRVLRSPGFDLNRHSIDPVSLVNPRFQQARSGGILLSIKLMTLP